MMIGNPITHHKYIVRVKAEEGDIRPEGMTLSLVGAVSADSYWSNWCIMWDMPYRRRFSMNPNDYIWEPKLENLRRNDHDNTMYLERGLITFEEGIRTYHGPKYTWTLDEWCERGGIKRHAIVLAYYAKIKRKREAGMPAAIFEGVEYY